MTRTKTVYPTREIAHLWAHQTQPAARNQIRNFYFDGDTIYSYGSHFPIARLIKVAWQSGRGNDERCVFFTTRGYSVTTAKHISFVRRAIPHNVPIFETRNVNASPREVWKEKIEALREARRALDAVAGWKVKRCIAWERFNAAYHACQTFAEYFRWYSKLRQIEKLRPDNWEALRTEANERRENIEGRSEARREVNRGR